MLIGRSSRLDYPRRARSSDPALWRVLLRELLPTIVPLLCVDDTPPVASGCMLF